MASLKLRHGDMALDLAAAINQLLWKRGRYETASLRSVPQGTGERHLVTAESLDQGELTALMRIVLAGADPHQIEEAAVQAEMHAPSLGGRPHGE